MALVIFFSIMTCALSVRSMIRVILLRFHVMTHELVYEPSSGKYIYEMPQLAYINPGIERRFAGASEEPEQLLMR